MGFSDDIYMKNGAILKNVTIKKTDSKTKIIYVTTDGKERSIMKRTVLRINKKEILPDQEFTLIRPDRPIDKSNDKNINIKYPNMKLLPVSMIAFTLAYMSFDAIEDVPKNTDLNTIKHVSDIKEDNSKNKIYLGIYLAAGVINTFFVFQSVQVYADDKTAGLSIEF